jgi:hypothetical protein
VSEAETLPLIGRQISKLYKYDVLPFKKQYNGHYSIYVSKRPSDLYYAASMNWLGTWRGIIHVFGDDSYTHAVLGGSSIGLS